MWELRCDGCGNPIDKVGERWYQIIQHCGHATITPLKRDLCRYCSLEIMEFLVSDLKKEIESDESED